MGVGALQMSARTSRRPLLVIMLATGVVGGAAAALMFAWPDAGGQGGRFQLGATEEFAVGRVETFAGGKFHLVRLARDEFVALSWTDPHSQCAVPWRPDFVFEGARGWFRDPCHRSTYSRVGRLVSGPSPRDLDRYPVSIINDRVVVRTDRYVCGYAPPGAACDP
jgi:Rieske Fe-S protein